MDENLLNEIKNMFDESDILREIKNLTSVDKKIIKLYVDNGLLTIPTITEEQYKTKNLNYTYLRACLNENYDYLNGFVNCRYNLDKADYTENKTGIAGTYGNLCSKCKLTKCIKNVLVNFIFEVNSYNNKNKKNIQLRDAANYLFEEKNNKKIMQQYYELEKLSMISNYNLFFIEAMLDSDFIALRDYNEFSKIAKLAYVKLDKLDGYEYYIYKIYDFYSGIYKDEIEINVENFDFIKNNTETDREYQIRVAAYFKYLMVCKNIDIIGAINKYIENNKNLISSKRSIYYYELYMKKVRELPYSSTVKEKIYNLFNYVVNCNYITATPYITFNIVMYTEDKETVNQLTRIISNFMWYFNFLPNNMRTYHESMNGMILDGYAISKIYYDTVNKKNKVGFMVIDNFENLLYTDDLKRNMIINLLTDQLENNRQIFTVIYGNKTTIQPIIEKYPNLNHNIFNIQLDLDELDTDNLYKVITEKLVKTENVSKEAKDKLYKYIKSSYAKSEIKNMEYIKELYTQIILNNNKVVDKKEKRIIEQDDIPDVYNTKNLDEILKDLNSLVGLDDIKTQINNLIYLLKFNKKVNLDINNMNLHMVFEGNPGTGKTTVARLVSSILHNLGYVKQDKLVEVSAKDLIADYVGQTSGKTYRALKSAFGGVLFIDEAYSIFQSGHNSFGAECIATILKTMEDNKKDLVIIFAGYEKEMKEFVDSNPGLKSRIGYDIKFNDYSIKELYGIFERLLEKNSLKISDKAKELVEEVIEESCKIENFGNGRYINNMFQNILIEHAKNTNESENEEQLYTINELDINKENLIAKSIKRNRIGF